MNNLNIDGSSVQSLQKIRFKKIFGGWCLANNLSSETKILSLVVKQCETLKKKIEKLEKKKKIIENDLEIMQNPWIKLKKFLKDLVKFRRERNIKLKVADRLDYCDLLEPYHKLECAYKRNRMLLKKFRKELQYVKLFISLSK